MQINNLPTSAIAYLKKSLQQADQHESNKQEIKCKTVSKIFPSIHVGETNKNQAKRPVQIKQKFFFQAALA